MVNLEWYRTFKSIYQNGNLTRASEELLISQPNVSIQLAALESYIGQKLFLRHPRKLEPTEFGKMLYAQIVESIENLERVEVEFRKSALARLQQLKIGSPIEYANNILLKKLGECNKDINLQFGLPDVLMKKLQDRSLDFVIATKKTVTDGIIYEPLVEESFMIIAHANYDCKELEQRIKENNITGVEEWLLNQKWIAYDNKLSIIRRFWLENFGKRPLIKPHQVIPDINMMIKAVHFNYGITIASDLLVGESLTHQQLKILWKGNENTKNQLWLAYNPAYVNENQIEEIRQILGISTTE